MVTSAREVQEMFSGTLTAFPHQNEMVQCWAESSRIGVDHCPALDLNGLMVMMMVILTRSDNVYTDKL